MVHTLSLELSGRTLILETGRLAKQASGAVLARYGDTVVLSAAVVSREETDRDFLPLLVDYREKTYAAGRIPGGFFKREGRPNEKEILSSRLIDRSLRPLFEKGMRFDVQITAEVLSSDQENDGDVLGLIGASCALNLSDLPFPGPIGAVRIGLGSDGFIVNPTSADLEESRMNIDHGRDRGFHRHGRRGSARNHRGAARRRLPSSLTLTSATSSGCRGQLIEAAGKPKRVWVPKASDPEVREKVISSYGPRVKEVIRTAEKAEREAGMRAVDKEAVEALAEPLSRRRRTTSGRRCTTSRSSSCAG